MTRPGVTTVEAASPAVPPTPAAGSAGTVDGMAMRWLTREWQSGALPDAEQETRWQTYLEHRDTTAIHLPPALHRLAAVGIDGALTLHQAIPDWWALEPEKAFTLAVIADDAQDPSGPPQRITLQYAGNLEVSGDAAELDLWLTAPDARLLYDEIEVLPGRRFEQRFLLQPEGELSVRFDNVLVLSAPATSGDRDALIARRAPSNGSEPATPSPAAAAAVPSPGADPIEGAPAPVPATAPAPAKRSLRDLLLGWLPGVRAKH